MRTTDKFGKKLNGNCKNYSLFVDILVSCDNLNLHCHGRKGTCNSFFFRSKLSCLYTYSNYLTRNQLKNSFWLKCKDKNQQLDSKIVN